MSREQCSYPVVSSPNQRDGFKRVGEHREGCLCAGTPAAFVITDSDKPFDFGLKRNGHRGGSQMWWRFTCNDLACDAKLLVRWDVMMWFVNGTEHCCS